MASPLREPQPARAGLSPRVATALAAAVIGAAALWLLAPALFSGQALWGSDCQSSGLPLLTAARRLWDAGSWPVWLPEWNAGMPGLASLNLDFLHPVYFLSAVLRIEPYQAFAIAGALAVALSGWGMLAFCRWLGASMPASLFGALAYALSGTQVSGMFAGHSNNVQAYALIPWVFYGAARGLAPGLDREGRGAWWGFALAGAALGCMGLGLGFQIVAYAAPVAVLFALYLALRGGADRRGGVVALLGWRLWAGMALLAGVAALVAAPQLLPSLEYLPLSWRQGMSWESFCSWSMEPAEALSWLVPGAFGWRSPWYFGGWDFCLTSEYFGIVPWTLAAAALAAAWGKRRAAAWGLAGVALVGLVLALGGHSPLHRLFFHLPVFNGFRSWVRALCLVTFAVSALAALGLDALAGRARARWAAAGAGLLAALAGAWVFAMAPQWAASARALAHAGSLEAARLSILPQVSDSALHAIVFGLLAAALAAAWALQARRGFWLVALPALLALHLADMAPMHQRYVTFTPAMAAVERPDWLAGLPDPPAADAEPWRVWLAPQWSQQNQAARLGYEQAGNYHGMMMGSWRGLQQALEGRTVEFWRLLGVRYVLMDREVRAPFLRPLGVRGGAYLYAFDLSLPRAFLCDRTLPVETQDQAFTVTKSAPLLNPVVAVTEGGPSLAGSGKPLGRVAWVKRSALAIELEVDTPADAVLAVTQSWYPRWRATVDGKPERILRAWGALQAVPVKAGRHTVRLTYETGRLVPGLALAVLGLLACAGAVWAGRRP